MRRWQRRVLILLGALLLAFEVVYLVGANYCINASWVQELVNKRPEKFRIRWGGGWTIWPRAVHIRNVEMRGASAKIEWYAHLDAVAASYRILPFFDRTAHLRSVSASGVDYRQRRRAEPGEAPQESDSELPTLPDFEAPVRDTSGGASAPKKGPGEPWTIIADEIDADVDQLWFDRYRLAGRMNVETGMKLLVRGPMEFPGVHFTMTEGDLKQGEREIMGGLHLDIETALPPVVPKGLKALDVIRLMSGRFKIRSDSTSLFFLEPYFKQIPWLHFEGRSAVTADLLLDGGVLQPGSSLESELDAMNTVFLDRRLLGKGHIRAKVEEEQAGRRADFEILLDEFSLSSLDEDEPYAHGRGFKVGATTTSLDLREPYGSLSVTADLPEAVVPDLSWYNRYIPATAGLKITSGTGRIGYHVEGSQEEHSLHGRVLLSADNAVMNFENYEARGDINVEVVLKDLKVREGRYDISGTKVDLNSDKFPWKASISLPKAEMSFSEPMTVDAEILMTMTDTTPLVAMFDAQKDISGFIEKLMTIRDIQSTAAFRVNDAGVEINGLEVNGEKLQVLSDLALHEGGKDGIMYIKFHAFSVGVEFKDGKKNLDLVRAKKWFDRRRSERRAGS